MKLNIALAMAVSFPAVASAQTCPNSLVVQGAPSHLVTTTVFAETAKGSDIVDTAEAAGSFKTLVAAVKAAGLVDVFKSDGPFTVFAPTDEAFAKLPKEAVAELLKPENKTKLQKLLTYHVVKGKLSAKQVAISHGLSSVQGEQIDVTSTGGKTQVDGANVVMPNISASNGVIHVIDAVIMPATEDIMEIAASNDEFSTLVAAINAAGLVETLKGEGPFTVFAPTKEAFEKLPPGTIENLLKPENKKDLTMILTYHVVPGKVLSSAAGNVKAAKTVNGQSLTIAVKDHAIEIKNAKVVTADIEATNGVIHVIDTVLLPE